MIGFYDYTVVVTYISLVSSILGMFCAIDGRLTLAVSCLAFSGLCDMFDGKIARTKKNRTDDEKPLAFRSILSVTLSVLGFFQSFWATNLECVKHTALRSLHFTGWQE